MGLEEFLLTRARREGVELGEKRGEKRGEEQKIYVVVSNMIRQTAFSDMEIATLADVPVSFVQQVRRESVARS
jgi:predicted XRE-type DNA-binding protein